MKYVNTPTVERSIEEIFTTTCEYFNIDLKKIRSESRKRELVNARSIASYISYVYYNHDQTKIAEFTKRERTFVNHSKDTVENLISIEFYSTRREVKDILAKLEFVQEDYDYKVEVTNLRAEIYNIKKELRELKIKLRLKEEEKISKYVWE